MSRLTIFLYHEVSDNPSQFCNDFKLNVPPVLFQKQIEWINRNFTVISPIELLNKSVLPKNAALITFDDAFKGAFENGISYLERKKIPSVMFMNMGHLEKRTPMISSKAIFLAKNKNLIFHNITESLNFENFHLTLSPSILAELIKEGIDNYDTAIMNYQGELADLGTITEYANSNYVFYGNHLFEHWNCQALSINEFRYNFNQNQERLSLFKNFINFFSFPNGQPKLCFDDSHVTELEGLGCLKVFSSSGSVNLNHGNMLLHRLVPTDLDSTYTKFKLRILSSYIENKYIKLFLSLIRKFSF